MEHRRKTWEREREKDNKKEIGTWEIMEEKKACCKNGGPVKYLKEKN